MKRYLIVFQGRVQGVGFRYFAYETASKLGLTGTVRNMANGCVECEIQGNSDDFSSFLGKMLKGNGFLRVEDYTVKEISLVPSEKTFKIIG